MNRRRLYRSGIAFIACVLLFAISSTPALSTETTLLWDPGPEPEIVGYGIYVREGPPGPYYRWVDDMYVSELAAPSRPSTTVTELENGTTYFFVVTAFDDVGNESPFSNGACVNVIDGIAQACPTGGGGGSGTCFISCRQPENMDYSYWVAAIPLVSFILLGFTVHRRD